MVSAVGHMHRRGMVHGDVKPENVLYKDEERLRVVLADFGFAQVPLPLPAPLFPSASDPLPLLSSAA